MDDAVAAARMADERDRSVAKVVERERSRLGRFIRGRVPDPRDAEEILQEVFAQLVEANRLLMPVEHVTGWLFRVARNRIVDLFRRERPESFSQLGVAGEDDDGRSFEDLLPSPDAGPEEAYLRGLLMEALDRAIDELPEEQRAVFLAHEIEGRSFKELSEATGVGVNTLLSRKRYAVLHLRKRLEAHLDLLKKG